MKDAFGLKTSKDILFAKVSADEVIKPLLHVVKEIISGSLTNRTLNTKADQENYVKSIPKDALPDLSKEIAETPTDSFGQADFITKPKKRRTRGPAKQKGIWQKSFNVMIDVDRIRDIFVELKYLEIEKNKNAIAVLMRIILEMSADEYMDRNGLERKRGTAPRLHDKTLAEKVSECCSHLISNGAKKHKLSSVTKSINNKSSPLYHDLLNQYVHNAYHNPSPGELKAGATALGVFLEHAWAKP